MDEFHKYPGFLHLIAEYESCLIKKKYPKIGDLIFENLSRAKINEDTTAPRNVE